MYSGTLIDDLFVLVEGAQNSATSRRIQSADPRAALQA